MARFLAFRLLALVAILWVLVTIVFFIRTVIPTNPARTLAGPGATPQLIALERQRLGLDKPILTQYADYLSQAVRGNLGVSIRTRNPVADDLKHAVPASSSCCSPPWSSLSRSVSRWGYSARHRCAARPRYGW